MKKIVAYLLIFLGTLGILLEIVTFWGIYKITAIYKSVNAPYDSLTYDYIKLVAILVIEIIAVVMGIRLLGSQQKDKLRWIILILTVLVFIFLLLNYSLPIFERLKERQLL